MGSGGLKKDREYDGYKISSFCNIHNLHARVIVPELIAEC